MQTLVLHQATYSSMGDTNFLHGQTGELCSNPPEIATPAQKLLLTLLNFEIMIQEPIKC
jgi:hypothetical protein